MSSFNKSLSIVTCLALASACYTPVAYRNARTLEPGQSRVGVNMRGGLSQISTSTPAHSYPDGNTTPAYSSPAQAYPTISLIPDLSFDMGVTENVEVGGRMVLSSMTGELDTKIRVFRAGDFHLAVQPTFALQAYLLAYAAAHATLPVIATYELNDMIALTGYGYGRGGHLRPVFGGDSTQLNVLGGGVGAGVELHGDSFFFMPYVDVSTDATFLGYQDVSLVRNDNLVFGLAFGYHGDLLRDINETVHRTEDKVDHLDQRVDQLEDTVEQRFDSVDDKLDRALQGGAQSQPADAEAAPAPRS